MLYLHTSLDNFCQNRITNFNLCYLYQQFKYRFMDTFSMFASLFIFTQRNNNITLFNTAIAFTNGITLYLNLKYFKMSVIRWIYSYDRFYFAEYFSIYMNTCLLGNFPKIFVQKNHYYEQLSLHKNVEHLYS